MALAIADGIRRGLKGIQIVRGDDRSPVPTEPSYWNGPGPIRYVSGPDYWPTRTASGFIVTADNALSLSAVYASVRLLATTAAGLPIHVYEESADGAPTAVRTSDTQYLWGDPNNEMTPQTFWEAVIGHEVLEGDAFIYVSKNGRGDVALEERASPGDMWGIWYIEPWRVRVGRTTDGRKVYQVDNEDVLFDFRAGGEIVHVPNWARSSLRGVNPISMARSAIGLASASQEYAERFFSQDSTPRGALSTDQDLSPEQADKLAAQWERNNAGLDKAHRTAVLSNGAKFQAISVNPDDAQLLEERRFQLSDIARFFGIPPHMLGDTERSTSWGTGIEEQTRGFLTYTLQAHINRIEQAIDSALLKRSKTNRYVKFELGGLLRPNLLQRYQAHALGYGRWLTANNIRRLEDLPDIAGGDDLLTMTNMIPVEQLMELVRAQNPPQNGGA